MKKIILLLTFSLSFLQIKADEGMWLMMLIKRLNGVDMQKQGLKLTPEEIYSVNKSSMKDAIVQFGGGCTAEVISKEGLILTNHHCGYGAIAALSTPQKDHLTDGFWAKKKTEELNSKGLSVRFLVRMDDVTQRIISKLNSGMSEEERNAIIETESKAIQSENTENGKYVVTVRSFLSGNEFYYFVYQDYKDVRLVGTPPKSIGKFGGDTDNWEWPRHTGDFSVFRVYGDKTGAPAEYSINNTPLKPKHFFPLSLKGYKEGSFSMIAGYPGRTNRYLTSFGIAQLVGKDYPAWVEASKVAMDVLKPHMDKSNEVKLNYASSYAGIANYWKNRQGTIDAVFKNGTIAMKQDVEKKFQIWANQPQNKGVYGNVLAGIENYYSFTAQRGVERNYLNMAARAKYLTYPSRIGTQLAMYTKQDAKGRMQSKEKLVSTVNSAYDGFHLAVESDLLFNMVNLYKNKVNPSNQLSTIKNTNSDVLVKGIYSSIFASKESVLKYIENPDLVALENDALYKFSNGWIEDNKLANQKYVLIDEKFSKDSRLFLDGLMKSQPEKKFYPDANSTMRLTYGSVQTLPVRSDRQYYGVSAKDNYYTTMEGTVAKYKKGDEEFDMPTKLIDLHNKRDYGQYADKNGKLFVNFLSDNDITGGNSGSPVIDANGYLIGIAFDGNSEALSGDIIYEGNVARTISVDIRYVLFIIDKFAGARHLLSEMTLVK